VWRVADHTLVSTCGNFQYPTGITFSPDGRRIALAFHGAVAGLFEIEGKQMIGELLGWESGSDVSIRFSDDGTGITLFDTMGEGSRSWEMVPRVESALDDDSVEVYYDKLPIRFILREHPFQHPSLALYKYDGGSEWITDQHNQRVLWLPTDLRGYLSWCQGSQVAIGLGSGRVFWFDFGLPSID
jgi:hypothetical protein